MYVYLSLVMILSVSSSMAASNCLISADTSGTLFICAWILSSFSNSLIAKNLFCSSGTSVSFFSTVSITLSTSGANLCTAAAALFFCASSIAFLVAFSIPVSFRAEISTTGQPSFSASFATLILSPFLFTISIMLTAMTTGIPSSISCVLRYKLRSMLVPSTRFRIASGLSPIR